MLGQKPEQMPEVEQNPEQNREQKLVQEPEQEPEQKPKKKKKSYGLAFYLGKNDLRAMKRTLYDMHSYPEVVFSHIVACLPLCCTFMFMQIYITIVAYILSTPI